MRRYKKRGCIGTVLLFPFYMIYFAFTLCGSFLLGVLTFLWELIKLPFKSKQPMTGIEYESHVADYLKSKGYWGVKVTQASGDYGIDVTAHKNGKKYAVQCKYYSRPVGIAAVQEAVAGMAYYNCDRAMVVTNSTYTSAAKELAKYNNVILLEQVEADSTHFNHFSLCSSIKEKIADRNINRVIKPGTPKKHFWVKGEIDKEQNYDQTGERHGKLHNSSITGLPHKFTVLGKPYDIDSIDDVRSFPLNFSSFHINGTKYFFNDYFRLCAKFYRDEGYTELANALEEKAVEIETAPLFGLYVKESSQTVIKPPKVKK